MKYFLLQGTDPGDEIDPVKTWFVIADDEDAARSLIPADFEVDGAEAHEGKFDGPARVIGWMGAVKYLK